MGIDVENISLPKFEKEKYLEHGKKTYEMREEVEKIADEVFAKGAKNIVLIGIGGTEFEMMAINYILKNIAQLILHYTMRLMPIHFILEKLQKIH